MTFPEINVLFRKMLNVILGRVFLWIVAHTSYVQLPR